MKKINLRILSAIVLVTSVTFGGTGRVVAQSQQTFASTETMNSLLQKSENAATMKCEAAVAKQRTHLASFGSRSRCRSFASGVIDWEEKFAQGSDAFGASDGSTGRMRNLFEKHIIDETAFSKQLAVAYGQLQRELIAETVQICMDGDVLREDLLQILQVWEIKDGAWTGVLDYVPRRAAAMSKQDWFREILEFAGTDIAADVVEDTARGVGLWNHKEGSWGDALAKFTTQLVVEAIVAEVTDPVGDVAKRLQADFERCSEVVIDGKHGFREACVALTQHHIESRRKLLAGAGKAVSK